MVNLYMVLHVMTIYVNNIYIYKWYIVLYDMTIYVNNIHGFQSRDFLVVGAIFRTFA